jgi:phosphatidylinositol alpha-mannosyltransferase
MPENVRLWVASDGPDTARLRDAYSNDHRIEWLGRITDDEKLRRMQSAHVYCAPSLRGESFGVVLLEAMAAGVPIVASDIDGYRNVATDQVDAMLVEPGNPNALAQALTRVIGDDQIAEKLTIAGLQRAQQFSMEALAHRYVELYREAIAGASIVQSRSSRMIGMLTGNGRKR